MTPARELDGATLHWKRRILTTGPSGKSLLSPICESGEGHFVLHPWLPATAAEPCFSSCSPSSCLALEIPEAHGRLLCPFSHGQRQEYWSRFPRPTPGDLPDPGIELASPAPPALVGIFFTHCTTYIYQEIVVTGSICCLGWRTCLDCIYYSRLQASLL